MDKFRKVIAKTVRIIRIISLVFVSLFGLLAFIAKYLKFTFIDDVLAFIHYPWPYDSFWLLCGIALAVLIISHIIVEKYFSYD